jgi:hypothetical protein
MTTIAWSGVTLASDRQITDNGRPMVGTKIWRIKVKGKVYLLGCCGGYGAALKFIEHFKKNGFSRLPEIRDTSVLIIGKDGAWSYEEDGTLSPMNESPWGIGSGGDYALGAMMAGATAEEAVAIGIELDVNSGLGIDTVKF